MSTKHRRIFSTTKEAIVKAVSKPYLEHMNLD